MPSPKDPNVAVQPGPGNLPDGTVSASALNFNPAAASSTALQAHINNPVGAHAASAISLPAVGGITHNWYNNSGDVESAMEMAYNGLNARGVFVLDANPASTDADFAGPAALTTALAFLDNNHEAHFFLRPGTYTFSGTLTGISLYGRGPNQVIIQNSGGNISVGPHCNISGITLVASGNVQIGSSGPGYNTFRDVGFNTGGQLNVASDNNVFENVANPVGFGLSSADLYIQVSGSNNTFKNVLGNQIAVSGSYTSFDGVSLGAFAPFGLAPKFAGLPEIDVSGSHNSFKRVLVNYTAAITGTVLTVSGQHNDVDGLVVTGMNTTQDVVQISGGHNKIRGVYVTSTTSANVVHLTSAASSNVVSGILASSSTIAASFSFVLVEGNSNEVSDMSFSGPSGNPDSLVTLSGKSNIVKNVTALARPGVGGSFIKVSGSTNTLLDYVQESTPFAVGTVAWVRVTGESHRLSAIRGDTLSTVACPLFLLTAANNCDVSGIELLSVGATTGSGFQLINMDTCHDSKVRDLQAGSSPNWGTTSGLISLTSSRECVVDGLALNGVGTATAVNSALVISPITANANINCTLKRFDLAAGNYVCVASQKIFNIDATAWPGLTIEDCHIVAGHTTGNLLYVTGFQASIPLGAKNCYFQQTHVSSSHVVFLDQGWSFQLDKCMVISGNTNNTGCAISFFACPGVVITNSVFKGQTVVTGTSAAGSSMRGCQIIGFDNARTGTFGSLIDVGALSMSNTAIVVGKSNVLTSGSTNTPIIKFSADTHTSNVSVDPSSAFFVDNWHVGTTVGVLGYGTYSDLRINLGGNGFSASGAGNSISVSNLDGLGTNSAMLEIIAYNGGDTWNKPKFTAVTITGLSTGNGAGGRHVVKASGADIDGLILDGSSTATTSSGSSWGAPAITLKYCTLDNLRLWTVGPIQVGSSNPYVLAVCSVIRRAMVNKLATISPAAIAGQLFSLTGDNGVSDSVCVLRDCRIDATSSPTLLTTLIIAGIQTAVESNDIALAESTNPYAEIININGYKSRVNQNRITYNRNSDTVPFVRIGTPGSVTVFESEVAGNVLVASVAAVNAFMVAADAQRSSVRDNFFSNELAGSCYVKTKGLYSKVAGNHFSFSVTAGVQNPSILIGGRMNIVDGNTIVNTSATSGYARIETSNAGGDDGSYCRVVNNTLFCTSSFFNGAVINTQNTTNNIIIGNHLENSDVGVSGSIVNNITDKPSGTASIADCNQFT